MTSRELENLVNTRQLKREPPSRREFDGLVRSGETRLNDAAKEGLADESRFDLAYNAAHALSLGGAAPSRLPIGQPHLAFQTLPHTLGMPAPTWRVLALCHNRRNLAEYEGVLEVDDQLLIDLIRATQAVLEALRKVPAPEDEP